MAGFYVVHGFYPGDKESTLLPTIPASIAFLHSRDVRSVSCVIT
jgi:hypothetical protein